MLKILLIMISFLGYYLLCFCAFHGKKTALYPAFITSAIILAGFVSGLYGVMGSAYSFVFYLGFLFIPFCLWHLIRQKSLNRSIHLMIEGFLPFAVFSVGMIWLSIALDGYFLYNPDDFSHWGRIARIISSYMRFPLETDLLTHASYPPGSALFIGYISSIIGTSDSNWLFAQALLLLSFWITLLSASKNIWLKLMLSVMVIPFMGYNTPLRALFVDNLLAAAVFAGIAACLESQKDEMPLDFFALSTILCAVCLIKNSGLFFSILLALYAVYLYWKNKHKVSFSLLFLILPILLYAIWSRYIDLYFFEDLYHQMSLDNYQSVLKSKTPDDIKTILNIILPIMLNPLRNQALCVFPAYLVILLVYAQQKTLHSKCNMLVFAVLLFVVYQVGILLMYIFSMPMEEIIAQNGQDYDRYNGTISAVLLAFLVYQAGSLSYVNFEKNSRARQACAIVAGVVVLVLAGYLLLKGNNPLQPISYQISKYKTAYRFSLLHEEISEIPSDSQCIVYFSEGDTQEYYARSISQYYLRSENISRCYDEEEAMALYTSTPWAYYIDLSAERVYSPTETVNKKLFTRTTSSTFTNVLDQEGYKENTRYSVSSEADIIIPHFDVTGYLPVKAGDIVRLDNVLWYPAAYNEGYVGVYLFSRDNQYKWHSTFETEEDAANWNPVYDHQGNIVQITVPQNVGSSALYIRIICQDIYESSIITINEEIK